MNIIQEDYVSFEVANLLKEKGFHEPCIATYNLTTKDFAVEEIYQDWTTHWKTYVSAPTLQMAMKWLREVHKICIVVYPFTHRERGTYTSDICTVTMTMEEGHLRGVWNSYEEACEASIKYSLENLI